VRPIARSRLPSARERSPTRATVAPALAASRLPSRASLRTPAPASPASVGSRTSASTTLASTRTTRARKRLSRCTLPITSRQRPATTSAPSRRVSLPTVDSSGTRAAIAIRQKRRRCSASEPSRISVS
jgi:hypothetical protein